MKKIYNLFIHLFLMLIICTSCAENEPFETITENDNPMILDPIFPDRNNGDLGIISQITHDSNLKLTVSVTPSKYTEVTWFIDGREVHKGFSIDKSLEAGTYHLKIVATTTAGKSTYREAYVVVSALEGEPWSERVGLERIVAPGKNARLYGINLDNVQKINIGGIIVDIVSLGSDSNGQYIDYVVPQDLQDGDYRISLIDNTGLSYGAEIVKSTSKPVILSGYNHAKSSESWLMTGINLDKVTSVDVNGTIITTFSKQSFSELELVCPQLEDGQYSLKATYADQNVLFYKDGEMYDGAKFVVISEQILWEGHHYVSWDKPDGDPNKQFNSISKEVFDSVLPGSKLVVYYSIEPSAAYHKIGTRTGNWTTLPGTSEYEFTEDGFVEINITDEILTLIKNENGFICVGHGYYVDRVSIK